MPLPPRFYAPRSRAPRCAGQRPGERGYARVAAVAGIAVMAIMAMTIATFTQAKIATLEAENSQARLSAAADAGVLIAVNGLLRKTTGNTWPIDGTLRRGSFSGVPLDIVVEDERGKIMLNRIDEENVNWLLESMGLSGDQLAIARDSFLDWVDNDDEPRDFGAEQEWYAASRRKPPNAGMLSVDELAEIRGWTPQMVARIAPIATVDSGEFPFEAGTATPLAIKVMTDGEDNSLAILERQREMNGQKVALEFSDPKRLVNRALTIKVVAKGSGGARATRRALVFLTGKPSRPYYTLWAL